MSADILASNDTDLAMPWISPKLFASVAVVLALAVIAAQIAPRANRNVESIRVDGAFVHLSPEQLAAAAEVVPGTRLFDLDLNGIRDRLEALPWVAHAQVRRVWPDRLELSVDERVVVARWGTEGLLDQDGLAFSPDSADLGPALPLLSGPSDRRADVWSAYASLSTVLDGGPLALAGLSLDARGEWTAQTVSGISMRFGQGDPASREALLAGAVQANLGDKLANVAYLDLRYPNGFAVGWRSAATGRPEPVVTKVSLGSQ